MLSLEELDFSHVLNLGKIEWWSFGSDLSDISVSLKLVDESVVINDIIFWIILIFDLFIIRYISVSKFVAVDLSGSDLSDISVSLELVDKSIVINDIIFWIILIFNLFIIRYISVGKFVAIDLSGSHLIERDSLSLRNISMSLPYVGETCIICNI